ncbi:uncharacterized protein [Diabrotica undecimpunctata]|uniref:uncharacterized protein n=1 Tax=Diabrotica undecimpunctata TaxID=50387 RepID=UPI003B63C0D1
MIQRLKCLQINLQHSKSATSVFRKRFIDDSLAIGILQEPWINGRLIQGLNIKSGRLLYNINTDNPRAALLLSHNIKYISVPEFTTADVVTAIVEMPTEVGKRQIIIASAYLPGDSENHPPPEEVQRLMGWCKSKNRQLIIGCDSNSHHTVWGSTGINSRGEHLLDYISANNLDIANRGNKPTFINAIRKEVLDITLTSSFIANKIYNWHVSNEASMSDHQHIRFDLGASEEGLEEYRVPKQTDWDTYKECLDSEMEELDTSLDTEENLD